MCLKKNSKGIILLKSAGGFTLVEALLSVALLALVASTIGAPYITGLMSLDGQKERMLLDSRLRNQMEILVSTDFALLADGSEAVTVLGENYTISWTVAGIDLDGDSTPEPDAKQVTVSVNGLSGASLTTIIVNNDGRVSKI